MPQYTDRDCVAIRVKWTDQEVVVASAYLAHTSDIPSITIQNLVAYCENKGLPLLIGCDANAHHTVWGSTDVNERGELLLEYLSTTTLEVANIGREPTFVTRRMKQVLDLTLVTADFHSRLKDWKVDSNESFSDHKYILFRIMSRPDPVFYRNQRKTNWREYKERLSESWPEATVNVSCPEDIDQLAEGLGSKMKEAFENSCPLKRVRVKGPTNAYWTEELTALRRKVKAKDNGYVARGFTPQAKEELQAAKRAYKKALRSAKRTAWRTYTASLNEYPQVARLQKVLAQGPVKELGTLEKEDGSYTDNPQETLEYLLGIHFPSDPNSEEPETTHELWDDPVVHSIVNEDKVRKAIQTFGSFKAAGPDEVFPAMLKNVPERIVGDLTLLLQGCLKYGYTPKCWRMAKVIFLPKPGKGSYNRATSWRPISLTSYLLKLLERLVDWHIRTPELIGRLKQSGQTAYLRGLSTDYALHRVVAKVEQALKNDEIALGLFIDIHGAFNNITKKGMVNAMTENQVEPICVRFVGHMLGNRAVTANCRGSIVFRVVERGCPQGGVLSPLLWILTMDDLLDSLKKRFPQISQPAYADDLALIAMGKFPATVRDIMQEAVTFTSTWCQKVGLELADKTRALIFTRKRGIKMKPIRIGDAVVPIVLSQKYLGVTLDAKLDWNEHCQERARKCSIALMQCKRAVGKTWGYSPKVTHWIYTAIIRPTLTYGALVWVAATRVKVRTSRLERIQRMGLTMVTGSYRTAPTAALECLLNIPPIGLFLEETALRSAYRLKRDSLFIDLRGRIPKQVGLLSHSAILGKLMETIPEMGFPCDFKKEILQNNTFEVLKWSREDWDAGKADDQLENILCFTDGSRIDGRSGAGIHIKNLSSEIHDGWKIPLGIYPTIFQAEVVAICRAAVLLKEKAPNGVDISIFSDSLSTLDALTSSWPQPGLVRECQEAMNALAIGRKLYLNWIPAHRGFHGNEVADALAKEAAEMPFLGTEPSVAINEKMVWPILKERTRLNHVAKWDQLDSCASTKEIIQGPCRKLAKFCVGLSRKKISAFVQTITGHGDFKAYLYKIKVVSDPFCPRCAEEEEDRNHYLCRCTSLGNLREEILGHQFLEPRD